MRSRWLALIPIAALPLWSCQANPAPASSAPPAQVEAAVDGMGPSRVILSQQAVRRLDLQTASVVGLTGPAPVTRSVPYGAVIYDAQGDTWVYTVVGELTYVRHPVSIEFIEGNNAYLSQGPAQGMQVVSVGAAELFGTEFDVGP